MKKIHLTWKLTWEARSVTKVRRAMYVCKGQRLPSMVACCAGIVEATVGRLHYRPPDSSSPTPTGLSFTITFQAHLICPDRFCSISHDFCWCPGHQGCFQHRRHPELTMTLSVKTIAHSWEHTSPNTQLLRWRADSPAIPPQCLVCTACTPGALVFRHLIAQVAVQGGKTSGHFSSLDLAPQWAFAHHSLGYSGDSLKGAGRLAKPIPLGHAECLNSNHPWKIIQDHGAADHTNSSSAADVSTAHPSSRLWKKRSLCPCPALCFSNSRIQVQSHMRFSTELVFHVESTQTSSIRIYFKISVC